MQPQETAMEPQAQDSSQVTQPTQQLEQQPTVQEPPQITPAQQSTSQPSETPQPTLQQEQVPPNTQQ